jgi:hypothetical protein
MKTLDRLALRFIAALVLLVVVGYCFQLYADHWNARTHDTLADRQAADNCILADHSDFDMCIAKYDPPDTECRVAFSATCFSTLFKPEEFPHK